LFLNVTNDFLFLNAIKLNLKIGGLVRDSVSDALENLSNKQKLLLNLLHQLVKDCEFDWTMPQEQKVN